MHFPQPDTLTEGVPMLSRSPSDLTTQPPQGCLCSHPCPYVAGRQLPCVMARRMCARPSVCFAQLFSAATCVRRLACLSLIILSEHSSCSPAIYRLITALRLYLQLTLRLVINPCTALVSPVIAVGVR